MMSVAGASCDDRCGFVSQTFQGSSTGVAVRPTVLDVLVTVHVVGSTEGTLRAGDRVSVGIDDARAVLEQVA